MSEFIQKIVLKVFGNNPILATIFISMIPIIELRGAIPFGSSKEIWKDEALSVFEASVYSVVGSIISAIWLVITINVGYTYGWYPSEISGLIKGFIGLVIFGNMLGWSIWYDQTYIRPAIDSSFQVEIKNVPEGYRFEGYLVNRDTGERKNVIERAN